MPHKPSRRGLMSTVLGRMSAAGESLISDRHAESMLVGLLGEAEQVSDPAVAWTEVRTELASSWGYEDGPEGPSKPFIYSDGVAVIPVHGILLNRFNHCWGFVTGYDFIRRQMNLAEADDDVNLIVFDHDSPGGEAAGCDELAREINSLDTPTMALVNTLSCSGSYWLASPCNRVVCAPSGSVGSIGVYIQHMNVAKMFAEWGLEVEFVKNGDYKTAGNMFEPLDEKSRAYFQESVDQRAAEFHAAVAGFRGIEESVVKGTQARVMRPSEALSLGLIDAAEAPTTAVATFVAELGREEPPLEDSQEEVNMAMTDEERASVSTETRARIKGIMTHEEAKGREGLAEHLAYETDNTVEQASAILAASPRAEAKPADDGDNSNADDKAKKDDKSNADDNGDDNGDAGDGDGKEQSKSPSHFEKAMNDGKHPNVGPNATGGGDNEEVSAVDRILGAQTAMTGRKPVQA